MDDKGGWRQTRANKGGEGANGGKRGRNKGKDERIHTDTSKHMDFKSSGTAISNYCSYIARGCSSYHVQEAKKQIENLSKCSFKSRTETPSNMKL